MRQLKVKEIFKDKAPIMMLGFSLLMLLLISSFGHLMIGYEGLIEEGFRQLEEAEKIDVRGGMTIQVVNGETDIQMGIGFDGTINQLVNESSEIKLFLLQNGYVGTTVTASTNRYPIGKIVNDSEKVYYSSEGIKDHYFGQVFGDDTELVLWEKVIGDRMTESAMNIPNRMETFLGDITKENLSIEETFIDDPRVGFGHLKMKVVSYRGIINLEDIVKNLEGSGFKEALKATKAVESLERTELWFKVYLTPKGQIVGINIHSKGDDIGFEGDIFFEY